MTELSDGREQNNTTATTVQADADYDVGSEQVIVRPQTKQDGATNN